MNIQDSIEVAKNARNFSYSPYSNYMVGAALVTKSGKTYTGCNIENDGIMSICAERVAFSKAISEGEKDFNYIVVVGAPKDKPLLEATPCGYCRQFISEFVDSDFKIYTYSEETGLKEYYIKDLLPYAFKL